MKRTGVAVLAVLFAGTLVLPFAIVFGGSAAFNGMSMAVRLLALSAFTLIRWQILTGVLMRPLRKLFRPKAIWKIHRWLGEAAFAVVVGHAYLVLGFGIFKAGLVRITFRDLWASGDALHRSALVLGIANLGLISTTVVTALLMRALRKFWRQVHYLNYLAFAVVLFHGLTLGTDVRNSWWVTVLFIVYGALGAGALGWRLIGVSRRRAAQAQRKPQGMPAGKPPPA